MGNIAKESAVLITWFKKGACPQNQLTNLLARARSSSATDKSKSVHRPKHYTNPPIFDGMKTQWHNASLIKFANFQNAIFRRELDR
jgi:hypothetical protein